MKIPTPKPWPTYWPTLTADQCDPWPIPLFESIGRSPDLQSDDIKSQERQGAIARLAQVRREQRWLRLRVAATDGAQRTSAIACLRPVIPNYLPSYPGARPATAAT